MNSFEYEIIDGLRKGEKPVFNLVFNKYYSGLCHFANNYLRCFENAEEIVQEVFLKLWENHSDIKINNSLKSYLYRCVQNKCLNFIRDNIINSNKNINLDEMNHHSELLLIEIPENVFDSLFSEKLEQELDKTVLELPDQCRTIFEMSRNENRSYPEIAKILNVSLSTVKTQMSRAVTKIHDKMIPYL